MTPLANDPQISEPGLTDSQALIQEVEPSKAINSILAEPNSIAQVVDTNTFDVTKIIFWQAPYYLVFQQQDTLRLLSVTKLDLQLKLQVIKQRWHEKLVSQPLLLPVKISVSEKVANFVQINENQFHHIGMEIRQQNSTTLQIRQFPALLRNQDIANSFDKLIKQLDVESTTEVHTETAWQVALAELMLSRETTQAYALQVWRNAESHFNCQFEQQLRLNSVVIDLTSFINQIE